MASVRGVRAQQRPDRKAGRGVGPVSERALPVAPPLVYRPPPGYGWSPKIEILSEYYARMTEQVFDYGGMLKEYVGDELMAIFGAPIEQADHAVNSLLKSMMAIPATTKAYCHFGSSKQSDNRIDAHSGFRGSGSQPSFPLW